MKLAGKKKLISNKTIILVFWLIVIIAKVVRYTVMKESLVDRSRGFEVLYAILNDNLSFVPGAGLNTVAIIFKSINFLNLSTYEEFEFFITFFWDFLLILFVFKCKNIKTNAESFYVIMTIAVLNIFDFNLAKEPIQILYFVLIYLVLVSRLSEKNKLLLSLLVVMLCAYTFRTYYILIVLITLLILLFFKKILIYMKNSPKKATIILLTITYISMILFLTISKKIFINDYSEIMWVRTKGSIANSGIINVFPQSQNNIFIFGFDYIITIIRLLFPFELIISGPKYFIFMIYQFLVSFIYLKQMKNYETLKSNQKVAFAIYTGFILTSAIFEPDFGSWVRHEATTFPLLFLISGMLAFGGKEKNE